MTEGRGMARAPIILIILIVAALACVVAFALSGCGTRYQPPGEGLWRAL